MTLSPVDLTTLAGQIGLPVDSTVTLTGFAEMLATSDSSLAGFSTEVSPSFLVLSSGVASDVTNANSSGSQGTDMGASGVTDDTVSLEFSFIAPEGFSTFSFSFSFFSEEFPEYVGSSFNDFFSVQVNGTEVAIDTNGNPISVNNDFFSDSLVPVGTMFDGQTPPLQITAGIIPGEEVTVTLSLGDAGDGIYDSAAFIGDFTLATPQIMFVDFDGGLVGFDAPWYQIFTPDGFTLPGSGLSAADQQTILDAVNAIYSEFNITFVSEQPTSGDFATIVVGGDVDDLPGWMNAPSSLYGMADAVDFGNDDLNDWAFVLTEEIGTSAGDIAQIVQVIAHEAGHLLGLRHVDDDDALMTPYADPDATGLDDEDQDNAEIIDDVVTPVGGTQNSYEELVRNVGLVGAAPIIESESFFDEFLNFFGFSVGSPDVTIYNAIAVVFVPGDGAEGNVITSVVDLGNITDSGTGFVLPVFGGDQVAVIGQSTDGGAYDSVLSDGSTTNVNFEDLGLDGLLNVIGIEAFDLSGEDPTSNAIPLTFQAAAPDGSLTELSDAETILVDVSELDATEGADSLTGTTLGDNILGLGGSDDILGRGGNDTLYGNDGDDDISGGIGSDIANGGDGEDVIFGNNGFDVIDGGGDNDTLNGNAGADEISGGSGDDNLYGGINFDTLFGGNGDDTLNGEKGRDVLFGGTGEDDLSGNFGNDTLYGGAGDDLVNGGVGTDSIYGGAGSDDLNGNNGSDVLFGGDDNDIIRGNAGTDYLDGGEGNDILVGGIGTDTFVFTAGHDVVLDFQNNFDTVLISADFFGGAAPTDQEFMDAFEVVDGNLIAVFDDENSLRFNNITDVNQLVDDFDVIFDIA